MLLGAASDGKACHWQQASQGLALPAEHRKGSSQALCSRQVYRATRRNVQQVAVKRLTAVRDPMLLAAIRREITILQRVSFDPNIVQARRGCRKMLSTPLQNKCVKASAILFAADWHTCTVTV